MIGKADWNPLSHSIKKRTAKTLENKGFLPFSNVVLSLKSAL